MSRLWAIVLVLWPTVAMAADPTALMCFFKPLGMRFNIVEKNGQDMIQWDGDAFQAVMADFKDPYLTIRQYASAATFKAVIDIRQMKGYGSVALFKGEKAEGEIICAFD